MNLGTDTDKLCQAAWQLYEQGELDKAIDTAHAAKEHAQHPQQVVNSCAALGWFLIEKGDLVAAEEVLIPALQSAPHQAILHWRVGALQQKKGNLVQATQHFEQALAIDPSLDEAAASLAWMLHDLGRLSDACRWARHALAWRTTPERQTQLGWFLLTQGKAADAIPFFQESLKSAPQNENTYVHLARALNEEGMNARALHILTDALARFPASHALVLALAWQYRGAQAFDQVRPLAERAIAQQPDSSNAWLLLGLAEQGLGNFEIAATHFFHALELDATSVHAAIPLATYLRQKHSFTDAQAVIANAVLHHAEDPALRELQAQIALDMGDVAGARRHIHQLLTKDRTNGEMWLLLAKTLRKRGRNTIASAAVRRALRYLPYSAESWETAAWLAIEDDRLSDARLALKQLIARCPDLPDLDIRAAYILVACRDFQMAAMHADVAVARNPQSAQALQALGHVRHRQGYLREAEEITQQALTLRPEWVASCLRQLGWIQRARGRLQDAADTFEQACEVDGLEPICLCECAQTQAFAGNLQTALLTIQRARKIGPTEPAVQLLHAQILRDLGPSNWNEVIVICTQLLRNRAQQRDAAFVLMALAAEGSTQALHTLRLLKRARQLKLYQEFLESSQARGSSAEYLALSSLALREFPDDILVKTAALGARSLSHTTSATAIARQTREWSRYIVMRAGTSPYNTLRQIPRTGRLRIAYVAAHFHQSLLVPVLAAHDFNMVDVFLYCDVPIETLGELANKVILQALERHDLAASMHANRIDVAIDTVGIGPYLGQDAVLQHFARRIAPVQCAWLGSWASAGGIFDYLLTDALAAPPARDAEYAESIARLPGGQWAWEPPACAPAVSAPPVIANGFVTLGCAVRAFRISAQAVQVWIRLLLRLPGARLVLMGEHGQNARLRQELFAALSAAGLDLGRIAFQPQCPYQDYLTGYSKIDIALDSFPANGGLCLLDALWMGVPVVTMAGTTLGERQGLSILGAIGHEEWVAQDEEGYIETVCALAGDPATLSSLRERLRSEIASSPLVDGRRVAQAIETHCRQWKQAATPIAEASSTKERVRAVAQRQLDIWLSSGGRLKFEQSGPPRPTPADVAVVMVLFNQAGLSRQALAALADQTDVAFETIVVDNASGADTKRLIDHLEGARIVRNTRNVGFLHAANQGAALATGRHILFLNSDAILQAGALRSAVARMDSDPRIGAVGGRIVLADGTLQEAGCIAYSGGSTAGYGRGQDPMRPEFSFVRDVDFCSGAFLLIRCTVWLELGGFDPVFAAAYYEDTDFCLRVREAGYRVVYDPTIWVSHFEWGSAASNENAIAMMQSNCARFNTRHQKHLSLRPLPTNASPHLDRWRVMRKTRILIIDNSVPHSAAGGGLPRARLIVQALSDCDLTLFPMWELAEDWREVYASVPETVEVMLGMGASNLEVFLQQRVGVYDFALVSRPPNMALVDALRTQQPHLFDGMRIVYDAEALFALREIRKAALRNASVSEAKAEQLLQEELNLARRADSVISVSANEVHTLRAAGVAHVHLLSHAMETRVQTPDWSQRENLLFVGAIHPDTPNEDSLLWFCQNVMPILRRDFNLILRLDIVGDCLSEPVSELAGEHIRIVGRIDDLIPYYDQHRVFIAPTRYAAGIPAKVIEAGCNGIPVVATPLLVSQLGWQTGHNILSADDPQAFAVAIATLYTDPMQWRRLRAAMQNTTREQYAPEQFQKTLRAIFSR